MSRATQERRGDAPPRAGRPGAIQGCPAPELASERSEKLVGFARKVGGEAVLPVHGASGPCLHGVGLRLPPQAPARRGGVAHPEPEGVLRLLPEVHKLVPDADRVLLGGLEEHVATDREASDRCPLRQGMEIVRWRVEMRGRRAGASRLAGGERTRQHEDRGDPEPTHRETTLSRAVDGAPVRRCRFEAKASASNRASRPCAVPGGPGGATGCMLRGRSPTSVVPPRAPARSRRSASHRRGWRPRMLRLRLRASA